MEERKYCVYIHTFPNGKKYVGLTGRKPHLRWRKGKGYEEGRHPAMYNAIQKYGWENVTSEIVRDKLTKEEACNLEIELITKFKTNIKEYGKGFGYNMDSGGEVPDVRRGSLNNNSKIVIFDGKEYENIREFCEKEKYVHNGILVGEKIVRGWILGKNSMPKYLYDKGLKYKGEKQRSFPRLTKERNYDQVVIYKNIEFKNIEDFCEKTKIEGLNKDLVYSWLRGKSGMPKKLYEDGLRYKNTIFPIFKQKQPSNKEIYYNDILFNSIKDLSKYLDVNISTVRNWIKGKGTPPDYFRNSNIKFKDEDTFGEIILSNIYKKEKSKKQNYVIKNEKQIQFDNTIYSSIVELNKDAFNNKYTRQTITRWLNGTSGTPTELYNKGLYYVGEEDKVYQKQKRIGTEFYYEDKYFESIVELSKYLNISDRTVKGWLRKQNRVPKYIIDGNLRYVNVEKYGVLELETQDEHKISKNYTGVKVVFDGKIYNSYSELSKVLNINDAIIGKWIKTDNFPEEYIGRIYKYEEQI